MIVSELFALFGLQVDRKSWSEGTRMLDGLKRAAGFFATGLGLAGITRFVEHAAEAGTHVLGMASALGMSAQSVQEWSYIAKQAGSDINQFAVGISMFERNLREFAAGRGSKRFKDAMRDINVTQNEVKTAMTGEDGINGAIFHVSDAYAAMGNSANRAAINTGLFGARARGMAQDLGRGSAVLRAQIAHLHELGGVLSDEQLGGLKKLNNNINDMKTAFGALATQVVGTLAPALAEMAESAAKWVAANRDIISGALEAALTIVAGLFRGIAFVVSTIGDTIRAAMGGDTGATAILIGLAVAIATLVIPALWGMVVPILLAVAPFLAIAAVAAAIAYGILQIKKHWDAVLSALHAVWGFLTGIVDSIWDFIKSIGEGFVAAWDSFKKSAKDAWEYAKSLKWAEAIPILGSLGKAIGHGAARLAGGGPEGTDAGLDASDLPDIDAIQRSPYGAMNGDDTIPVKTQVTGQTSVTVGPTSIQINVNSVDEAKQAKDSFDDNRDKQLRHAISGVAGAAQ